MRTYVLRYSDDVRKKVENLQHFATSPTGGINSILKHEMKAVS